MSEQAPIPGSGDATRSSAASCDPQNPRFSSETSCASPSTGPSVSPAIHGGLETSPTLNTVDDLDLAIRAGVEIDQPGQLLVDGDGTFRYVPFKDLSDEPARVLGRFCDYWWSRLGIVRAASIICSRMVAMELA